MSTTNIFDGTHACEICGNFEYIAGVVSSAIGPCSFLFCGVCAAMGAEPKTWIDALVTNVGGIDNVHERVRLIYFDHEQDAYIDYRTREIVPIETKRAKKFNTRTEYINFLKETK